MLNFHLHLFLYLFIYLVLVLPSLAFFSFVHLCFNSSWFYFIFLIVFGMMLFWVFYIMMVYDLGFLTLFSFFFPFCHHFWYGFIVPIRLHHVVFFFWELSCFFLGGNVVGSCLHHALFLLRGFLWCYFFMALLLQMFIMTCLKVCLHALCASCGKHLCIGFFIYFLLFILCLIFIFKCSLW